MKKTYRTIIDVLQSPWAEIQPHTRLETSDRVFRSSGLEDSIYTDLKNGDDELTQTNDEAVISSLSVLTNLTMAPSGDAGRIRTG